jgi:hypothetical protein
MKNAYKFLVEKPGSFGRPRRRWEDNGKMDVNNHRVQTGLIGASGENL